jgi:hypothetical protein
MGYRAIGRATISQPEILCDGSNLNRVLSSLFF